MRVRGEALDLRLQLAAVASPFFRVRRSVVFHSVAFAQMPAAGEAPDQSASSVFPNSGHARLSTEVIESLADGRVLMGPAAWSRLGSAIPL